MLSQRLAVPMFMCDFYSFNVRNVEFDFQLLIYRAWYCPGIAASQPQSSDSTNAAATPETSGKRAFANKLYEPGHKAFLPPRYAHRASATASNCIYDCSRSITASAADPPSQVL